jgi:hypothetical protein
MNVCFHRDGRVTVDKVYVGQWRAPDPSGAAWTRPADYIFHGIDGRVEQSSRRKFLKQFAVNTLRRKQREDAEAYTCADCGYEGFGAWNCDHCGQHNLIRK